MASRLIVVKIAYDGDAGVWFVDHSTLPGLAAEAASADTLIARIPAMIADLIEENGLEDGDEVHEVPVEIIASTSTRVRLHAA